MKLYAIEVGECGRIIVHAKNIDNAIEMAKKSMEEMGERFDYEIGKDNTIEITEPTLILEAGFGE
jgi:hypothetical protein